ncbi:hypothetical protein [Aliiroseovarius sp.]|uniref:hypothetical protein n=1 Tax=Aliiroseovarius sp. TaxID=1872442 RepID=UPI003BAAA309
MPEKDWQYWEINRGRFLCPEHGGFCDSCDGYAKECPICASGSGSVGRGYLVNPVDRALQVINGLQKRSKRNVSLVSGITGGLAGLSILAKLGKVADSENAFGFLGIQPIPWLYVSGLVLLILSVACFAGSMKQIDVTKDDEFLSCSIQEFQSYLAKETAKLEHLHRMAGFSFSLAATALVLSLFAPLLP